MLMQHVSEVDQVAEVDDLICDDDYQQSWMSHRRERRGIIVCNQAVRMKYRLELANGSRIKPRSAGT
jgi:hypothetical protein